MTTGGAGDDGTAERLRELHRLRDEGLITAEEFDAQRARILGQAFGPDAGPSDADPGDGSPAMRPTATPTRRSPSEDSPIGGDMGAEVPRSRFHPERWPGWLRITLTVVGGLWVVTIPFMFWRAARHTWLPYAGVAMLCALVLGIAVGGDGEDSPPSTAVQPEATRTSVRTPQPTAVPARTPLPTPPPAQPPSSQPQAGDQVSVGSLDLTVLSVEPYDASQDNQFNDQNVRVLVEAVNVRGDADEEYNLSAFAFKLVDSNGIAHDTGLGCAGCPDEIVGADLVRGGHIRGYVYFAVPANLQLVELIYEPLFSFNKARIRLPAVSSLASAPTPTLTPPVARPSLASQPRIGESVRVGNLDLTILGIESYDSTRHNQFNSANLRVEIEAMNARGAADAEYHLSSWAFELVDSNGIVRDMGIGGCASCPDTIGSVDLVQGGRIRGYIYFTIPQGRELVELIYRPTASDNKVRISLR